MGFERFRQGQYLGITSVRSGRKPLKASTLAARTSPSPSELFAPKIAGMTAATLEFDIDPELLLKVAAEAFLRRIEAHEKTASEPLFSEGELIEFFKQAGLLDNIRAWGGHFKNTLTGGDFASQMKSLTGGASSGMSGLKQTLNPTLQQIKGPGELALAHAAKEQATALAADRAAARLRLPDMSGVDRSLATSAVSPQAWGLPTAKARPLSPGMVQARGAAPAAAAATPASPVIQTPISPADFLRSQAQRRDPSLGAFGRDPLLGARAARAPAGA